jgi:hypothetical protein
MIKSIGITGTRQGWTTLQSLTFDSLIECVDQLFEFHHGVCVGVDCQSHQRVRFLAPDHGRIITHPSVDKKLQGDVVGDEGRPPKTHFARNRDIVNESDMLIVVPVQNVWVPKGGTWYTHDYGLKRNKPVFVIWPNGRLERRNDNSRPNSAKSADREVRLF